MLHFHLTHRSTPGRQNRHLGGPNAQYGADLPTPSTMNVTKVNYGSIEGLPMMHVHDAMLIQSEMRHFHLTHRSTPGRQNRYLGGPNAQYGADLPTPSTMNVTKVNYGSIEGLP